MSQVEYPTAADLSTYLTRAGFDSSIVASLDLITAAEAGVEAFEGKVGRKMLAPDLEETRYFDPPTNGSTLFIDDLAALTSVEYEPHGAAGETLTAGADFWATPYNAEAKGKPITALQFRRRWRGPLGLDYQRSLQITGKWGYATTVPSDAWMAMLQAGALFLFEQLAHSATGGLLGWKEADVSEDYGVETWARLRNGWQASFDRAITKYRLWRL